eukprot:4717249-Pyramimonas_sp.AAC.1
MATEAAWGSNGEAHVSARFLAQGLCDPSGLRRDIATGQPMFELRCMPTMVRGPMQAWGWLCEPCQMHAWDKAHFCGDHHKELITKQWKHGWPDPSQFDSLGNLWTRTNGTCTDKATGKHITRLKWDGWEPEWKAAPADWAKRGLLGPRIPMCCGRDMLFPPDWGHVPVLNPTTYQ